MRMLGVLVVGAIAIAGCGSSSSTDNAATTAAPPAKLAGLPITTHSPDSGAPTNAAAHWLPPQAWVYSHWLPYDEQRLYSLVHITRNELWDQLRNDQHTLAQLAAKHGWPDPQKLAVALVAPQAKSLGPERTKAMQQRALLTITQGHLAQHLFFHSLHQFAIASEAPEIFGVTDVEFRALRRAELSPLAIAALHGRSPGFVEARSIAVLRERATTGVHGKATPAAQAQRLLSRQISQLPRWLGQARYNGPPPTYRGALIALPQDYATNPAISGDGRFVSYEAYRQKLPLAIKLGEIAVMRADLSTGKDTIISRLPKGTAAGPDPRSAYNSAISGDGSEITYESAAGNQNFAKRYGRIGVLVAHAGTTKRIDEPVKDVPDSQSAYNPAISADGSREAYEAVRGGRTVVLVADTHSGAQRQVVRGATVGGASFADPYEPGLSADGSKLVYTMATGRVADPDQAGSEVYVRDVGTAKQTLVSQTDGGDPADGFSSDPSISPDGRWVAFTSDATNLGQTRGHPGLFLRDLRHHRTTHIAVDGGSPLDPVVSHNGRVVAFTVVDGATTSVKAWTRHGGDVRAVSSGDGVSDSPSISDDGTRVAFVSTATNLAPAKTDPTRAIYVHNLKTQTTRLISNPKAAYPPGALKALAGKPKPVPAPAAAPLPTIPDPGPNDVFIQDNQFFDNGARPTVRVDPGTKVAWHWQSRESHSIEVRSGPKRFTANERNRGSFQYTFEKPGTYHLVCELHAPGMQMTVVVR